MTEKPLSEYTRHELDLQFYYADDELRDLIRAEIYRRDEVYRKDADHDHHA